MLLSTSTAVRYRQTCDEEDEMGLMSRFTTMIKAKFSKWLDRAENPAETLDYSYEKQLQSLQNVKRGVADVVTAKKRLELQTQQLEQNVVKLETQARQALAAGREDLARAALERSEEHTSELQSRGHLVCRLLLEKKKNIIYYNRHTSQKKSYYN